RFISGTSVCYKPETKATRGTFLHQSTNDRLPPADGHVLPPAFDRQDEQFHRAFEILRSGIDQRAFPGASSAVAHPGKLIAYKGLGHFTYGRCSRSVKALTFYDLASVTKVIATTPACMVLYERGKFNLEQPLVEILPDFAGPGSLKNDPRRHKVTLRMLL